MISCHGDVVMLVMTYHNDAMLVMSCHGDVVIVVMSCHCDVVIIAMLCNFCHDRAEHCHNSDVVSRRAVMIVMSAPPPTCFVRRLFNGIQLLLSLRKRQIVLF